MNWGNSLIKEIIEEEIKWTSLLIDKLECVTYKYFLFYFNIIMRRNYAHIIIMIFF